jgi:hypothetical protein
MNADASLSMSAVERLPVELLGEVMSKLPDLHTLQMAALSCPAFYQAFTGAKSVLYTRVVLGKMDSRVLPEAVATLESSQLPEKLASPDQLMADFADRHLYQRIERTPSWNFEQAVRMERLHSQVGILARQFAEAALAEKFAATIGVPSNTSNVECAPPTSRELCRFERAFFRFETYINFARITYGDPKGSGYRMDPFFQNFSPWENEQLACIHDFLFRLVSSAYNELAEHDVRWGRGQVEYPGHAGDPEVQSVLQLGLEKLYQISLAKSYDQWCELMKIPLEPRLSYPNLYNELLYSCSSDIDSKYLRDFTREEEDYLVSSAFFADPDSGPVDIWWYMHLDDAPLQYVMSGYHRYLRKEAYVMWDRSRFDSLGIFDKSWDAQGVGWITPVSESHRGEVWDSFAARSKVYNDGGRGWWACGDLSRIRWTGRSASRRFAPY